MEQKVFFFFFVSIEIIVSAPGTGSYSSFLGFAHLGSGLCVGLSGLAAGMAIGIVGDAGDYLIIYNYFF